MTFINRRIIKRPTLFATSRRNFGNLLTHYETGQDGATPDPDPTPDPVTFSTSWSTNGGVVAANLTGISSHRTTEVIVLTRSDGTVLATLDENKVGDWDLQHDEGTGYGSYTYNVRLDGVIKSTFSRDYQSNVPTFTTNFFSNTAKIILCGIDNITNPHDSYSVRLARPDDKILDTQVLNDTSSFFLQFTESDYGTYDYKLLLSKWTTTSTSNPNIPPESYWVDTVIATHQQIFVRPEPTFTTGWTKSGLTISADLSDITSAHSDFYAYLCRTDGTTLSTQQFQTGQTTASLSFTETNYGTFGYQLKLGTSVVSSHTGTLRPTPTYTASFSTNELTLTASITSITNTHNSFAITLERDDGTVLQTHTLADGETSFTFTQTETSYATFNYVVKINGTQTDTYSSTYTPPPPTPTFDIALTNDDLAITATLTNIVNPDPYYTLMIHDVNDTHLDGHTFKAGVTTVTLTWTETSYDEKTYTKLLNGASIGTETITLTDPNASTTPSYEFDISNGNLNATSTWDGTSDNWPVPYSTGQLTVSNQTARWQSQEYASGYGASPGQFNPGILGVANYGPYDIQQSEAHDSTYHIVFTNNIWSITHSGFTWKITLIDPNASTPTVVSPLPALSQHTQTFGMEYYQTVGTKYYYKSDSHSGTGTSITYDYETKTWNDEGSQVPYHLNTTSTFASTTSLVNPAEIHAFGSQQNHNGTRYFSVSNPYYEAPAYRTGTSQSFAFTSGSWKNNGYSAVLDDEANSSSGKLVNGVRQWEWDMPDAGGGRLSSGTSHWIHLVPGTAEDNGIWYRGGSIGTRSGRTISFGDNATFDETNAFADGLVPYGDIP